MTMFILKKDSGIQEIHLQQNHEYKKNMLHICIQLMGIIDILC